jgi:hypothetical protein
MFWGLIERIETSKICSYLTSTRLCGRRYGRPKSNPFHCTSDMPLSATNHVVKSYPISTILISTDRSWVDLENCVTGFFWYDPVLWRCCTRLPKMCYYYFGLWRDKVEVRRGAERSMTKDLCIKCYVKCPEAVSEHDVLILNGSWPNILS